VLWLLQVSVYAHYQALLRQCNAVDFNDLLGHVVELLASHEG
jgi:superfamily I DNA/RNA helicase